MRVHRGGDRECHHGQARRHEQIRHHNEHGAGQEALDGREACSRVQMKLARTVR